ncbi:MAG: hypothetical protein K2W96_22980 [Gemmataceae bacterium]|nr:hypothetical protein [Gemmataceae bacterium]
MAESLLKLHRLMDARIRAGSVRFRQLLADQPVARFCQGKVRVRFLTPAPRHCHDYRSRLGEALATVAGTADEPADLPHNLTSGAVLAEFGKTRLLLMADAERPSWREWLVAPRDPSSYHPLHFVKSSHHGSENGCHPPLYSAMCDPALTLAILTPFGNGTTPLPTRAGIDALRPLVKDVYCTNRFLAQAASGLPWDGVPPAEIPALPERWRMMIVNRPALGDLLIPDLGGTPGVVLPALPRSWMQDAARDPELWRLLRGDACPPASSAPATDHIVSATYDNKGGLRRLVVGGGAGRLA